MTRVLLALTILAPGIFSLTGCGPSYSPDTYANNAAQQANKVDPGVVVGVRPVRISAQGVVGGVAGAAAGGVAGSQVGSGTTSTFSAIGGSLIGGIAGVTAEHIVGDTDGFEYIVRKPNGDLISVTQKDPKPLPIGQKVLVIAGPQARIVADYRVLPDTPSDTASKNPANGPPAVPSDASAHPAPATAAVPPVTAASPAQLPSAFGPTSPPSAPGVPPVVVPSLPEEPTPKP